MKRLITIIALALVCVQGFADVLWQEKNLKCLLTVQGENVYFMTLKDTAKPEQTNVLYLGTGVANARKTLNMLQDFYKSSKEGELKVMKDEYLKFGPEADIQAISKFEEYVLLYSGELYDSRGSAFDPSWVEPMLKALE